MARSRGKRGGDVRASPTVVTGTLGDPGDDDRLEVTFTIRDGNVRLRAGDQEIGLWSIEDVSMTQGGQSLWYFEAEGDRLPFVPTRPAALEASELVSKTPDEPHRRMRPRRSRAETSAPPTPVPSVSSTETESHSDGAVAPPKPPKRGNKGLRLPRLPAVPAVPRLRRAGSRIESPAPTPPRDTEPLRGRMWLRTVDAARNRGWFGLDRLPVNVRDRRGEHQHTWDHPAAASSGPAQHVCTICGAVRF